jgi:tetratricopeptide (TPR) repeat protein
VSGKLAADDGGTLDRAEISIWCQGEPMQSAHSDAHGNFTIALGLNAASEIGDMSMGWSGMTSRPSGDLSNCELRISAPGFVPNALEMEQAWSANTRKDFGTIVLRRLDRGAGQDVVSARSLAARPKARSAYMEGLKAAQNRDWTKAASHFTKATEIDHAFASAWSDLGRAQMMLGHDQDAEASLQKAIQADSRVPSAYEALSEISNRKEQWPKVLRWTAEALRLNPLHGARMWFLRSVAQYKTKDLNGAMESAVRGVSTDTDHRFPALELVQAQVLIDQGDLKSSVKHLQNFLDLRPTASNAVLIRQKMEEITASIQNATRNAADTHKEQAFSISEQ